MANFGFERRFYHDLHYFEVNYYYYY
jgi:hypothetical protein